LAQKFWSAVRQPSPAILLDLVQTKPKVLPYICDAMTRFLEELPSCNNGLSRTQEAILRAISVGYNSPTAIFSWVTDQEKYRFIGDWQVWHLISSLLEEKNPLIKTNNGTRFSFPLKDRSMMSHMELTTIGRKVLANEIDFISLSGVDHWWGGVHLKENNIWRFNKSKMEVYFQT